MIVGCYTLHLYCDFERDGKHGGVETYKIGWPAEFTGKTESECLKEARKAGWRIFKAEGKAKCPRCVKAAAQGDIPHDT